MKLLVISGGRHPYEETTPVLEGFLNEAGYDTTVHWDANILGNSNEMARYDVLIFNTLRFEETALDKSQQDGLEQFINSGKGFLCIHISGCVVSAWPEYQKITGGGWIMESSFHPLQESFLVNINNSDHPGVAGISDFYTNDELYMGIDFRSGNDVFMEATSVSGTYPWRGEEMEMPAGTFPLGWTREYGNGKVFVTLLGHNGLSFRTPEFQRLILNGINWITT